MATTDQRSRTLADLNALARSRERQWLRSIRRFLAGKSVVRALLRPRSSSSPSRSPVTFSRQRQSVAISPYVRCHMNDNEFYSLSSSSDTRSRAASCSRSAGLKICDSCKSTIAWYFGNLSRQVTELILIGQPVGSFVVRNSSSKYGTFVLSVRVHEESQRPTGVAHYLLVKSAKSRVQIKGFQSDFDCVQSLLTYYSRTTELMPCKLRLGEETADNHYHNEMRLSALAILTRS